MDLPGTGKELRDEAETSGMEMLSECGRTPERSGTTEATERVG